MGRSSAHRRHWPKNGLVDDTGESSWVPSARNASEETAKSVDGFPAEWRQQLLGHLSSVPSVTNCSRDVGRLCPGLDVDLLFECTEPLDAKRLFPPKFVVVPPSDGFPVDAGYLVVGFQTSVSDAGAAVQRLARAWWELVQASALLVTLIFVTSHTADGREELVVPAITFQQQHFECQAPAPLLFASCPVALWSVESRTSATRISAETEGGKEDGDYDDYDYDYDYEYDAEDTFQQKEESLFDDISAYLADGPREVQDLASNFAIRFNEAVRWNPNNSYSPDKKNDGSFKRWLLSRGLVAGAVFARNKCMVSIPQTEGFRERGSRRRGKNDPAAIVEAVAVECGPFEPHYGKGTEEAQNMEEEAVKHVMANGPMDMGALRQVKQLGARFNRLFFQKSKVNDGSWKRWLASLPGLEVVVDPKRAAYHGHQPTMVRPQIQ